MRRRGLLLGGFLLPLGPAARAQSQLGASAPTPPALAPNAQAAMLGDTVGAGFSRIVVARWGDEVLPGTPPFAPNALTPEQADGQFPYDGVIAGMVPAPAAQDGIPRQVMVVATQNIPARMVFAPGQDDKTVAGRMQGVTVLNLQFLGGRWLTVDGGYQTRRISDSALCWISGPAAAAIGANVQGVLGPEAGCATPWGTVLLAEGDAAAWLARLAGVGYGYADPAQAARFGWVVELDPLDPDSIPVKRTACGRLPRGGLAATQTSDGRAVVFFTQDAPAGALFRFIAATNATDGTALDSGTLAVAQLDGDGIKWVDLGNDVPTLVGLAGAAQSAGAEMFDAPGGLSLSQDGKALYMACAGNAARAVPDALNPGSSAGHILLFTPPDGDVTAAIFAGKIVLIAGNPATGEGTQYPPGATCWLRKPRTLGLDAGGRLWIGTDQGGDTSLTADGLFLLEGERLTNEYLAPMGAAMGGTVFDSGTRTAFAMVRHPGATPSASYNFPATRWPTLAPNMPPQSTVIGLVEA